MHFLIIEWTLIESQYNTSPRKMKRPKRMRHRPPMPNLHSKTQQWSRTNIIGESLSENELEKNVEPCVNKVNKHKLNEEKFMKKSRSTVKKERKRGSKHNVFNEKRKQLALDAQKQKHKRIIPLLKETGILKRALPSINLIRKYWSNVLATWIWRELPWRMFSRNGLCIILQRVFVIITN